MPELPEVETVRRVLEPQLLGRCIVGITLNRPEVVAHPAAEPFCAALTGQTVEAVGRRGKFLLLRLTGGDTLALHLRMTGRLLVAPPDFPAEAHTHAVFALSDGRELRFADPRRFGRLWLLRCGEADDCTGMQRLGLEPSDPALTAAYLQALLGTRRQALKAALLDQSVVAGIGNIYADEILHLARLHPQCSCRDLTPDQWRTLAETIPAALRWYTARNAISPEEYLAGHGTDYRNTPYLKMYGHDGDPCPDCGTPIVSVTVTGRRSCYCPACQPRQSVEP